MKKYKYTRDQIARFVLSATTKTGFDFFADLLATKPESDKEKCECYVEDSDSEDKCKKCGMSFGEHELKPDSVILVNDVKKFNCRSTKPQEELEVEEIVMIKRVIDGNEFSCYGLQEVGDKLNLLIKAHNALVSKVTNLVK